MPPIYFVTSNELRDLTDDDRLAAGAFAALGLTVDPLVWTERHVCDLARDAVLVLRSMWDYFIVPERFAAWLDAIERRGVTLLNPVPVVRWNMDKRYLLALETHGVPTVPTAWIPRNSDLTMRDARRMANSDDIVVKPICSGGAYETWRLSSTAQGDEPALRFRQLTRSFDLMVQPFMPQIAEGEWSLMFFDGLFSHAVRKRPLDDDFRCQAQFGGTITLAEPPVFVQDAACRVVRSLPQKDLPYARIDGIEVDGQFLLMEVECIEPVLFFQEWPRAAATFAASVVRHARDSAGKV